MLFLLQLAARFNPVEFPIGIRSCSEPVLVVARSGGHSYPLDPIGLSKLDCPALNVGVPRTRRRPHGTDALAVRLRHMISRPTPHQRAIARAEGTNQHRERQQ